MIHFSFQLDYNTDTATIKNVLNSGFFMDYF